LTSAIVGDEWSASGFGQLKIVMTSSGMEPATIRSVAASTNYATAHLLSLVVFSEKAAAEIM
jgi:hypothetical protein